MGCLLEKLRQWVALGSVCWALFFAGFTAYAQRPPANGGSRAGAGVSFKDLLRKGLTALEARDFATATNLLTQAFRVSPRTSLLFHLARACEKAGQPLEAYDLYRRYLADSARDVDPAATKSAEQFLAQAQPPSGSVNISADPGALISVDQRLVGVSPLALPLLVAPGAHTIGVEFPGKKLEAPVDVQIGRLIELRASQRSGALLVSMPPAMLLGPQPAARLGEAAKSLFEAMEQAARGEQYVLFPAEQAVLQAPELKTCVEEESCQRQLAQKNKLEFVLFHHVQLEGDLKGSPTWKLELRLYRADIAEPAAAAEAACGPCNVAQAAARLKDTTAKVLAEGLKRTAGTLQITAEPAAATIHIDRQAIGHAPYKEQLWTGTYETMIRHPGYQAERRSIAIANRESTELHVQLQKTLPPQVRWQRAPRPKWRLLLGGVLVGVGLGIAATGAVGLVRSGQCVDSPMLDGAACKTLYQTAAIGGAGVGVGAAVTIAGAVLLALPGPWQKVVVR